MEKILNTKYPPITSYSTDASVLSIISDNDKYLPWFFEKYTQMVTVNEGIGFFSFLFTEGNTCPHLDQIHLEADDASMCCKNEIVEFIIQSINDNHYIFLVANVDYISLYKNYNKESSHHPILIYGYNTEKKIFYVADFFRNGIFSFEMATYKEIQNSFTYSNPKKPMINGIYLLRKREHIQEFKISEVCNALSNYLIGGEFSKDFKFGLDAVYDRISLEIKRFKNNETYDNRIIPIFCDHKKVLVMLAEYLSAHGIISSDYIQWFKDLYMDAVTKRNNIIRLQIKNKVNRLDELYFEKNRTREKDLIKSFILSIDK